MLRPACHAKISFFGLLTLVALVVLDSCMLQAQEQILKRIPASKEPNLVRVNVISETRWTGDSVVINGKKLPDYQPRIVQVFPSTGVVLDDRGHVLTFLGYRWIEIQSQQPRNHYDSRSNPQGQDDRHRPKRWHSRCAIA
jgi:hypothetical protein